MRYFKFVGDPEDYRDKVQKGLVYEENYQPDVWSIPVISLVDQYPEDWQEVFFTPNETLIHQTDLGHYAGLAMTQMINVFAKDAFTFRDIPNRSLWLAKELIKQLKEEG